MTRNNHLERTACCYFSCTNWTRQIWWKVDTDSRDKQYIFTFLCALQGQLLEYFLNGREPRTLTLSVLKGESVFVRAVSCLPDVLHNYVVLSLIDRCFAYFTNAAARTASDWQKKVNSDSNSSEVHCFCKTFLIAWHSTCSHALSYLSTSAMGNHPNDVNSSRYSTWMLVALGRSNIIYVKS